MSSSPTRQAGRGVLRPLRRRFYRGLAASPHSPNARDIGSAARFAAQYAVNEAARCRSVQTQLIVLPRTT